MEKGKIIKLEFFGESANKTSHLKSSVIMLRISIDGGHYEFSEKNLCRRY